MHQANKVEKAAIKPKDDPKNLLKTAPVYPNKAEISSFSIIKIRDKSMGLNNVANKVNLSKGYSSNITKNIRKIPSYITEKNNHAKMA